MALRVPQADLIRVDITRPSSGQASLLRSSEGWRVESPVSYAANAPAVESIVAALAELQIIRRDSDRPAPRHRLAAKERITVRAWTREGQQRAFAIGASTRDETYVQLPGDEAVYALRGRCRRLFDLAPDELRDPSITKLVLRDILRARYRNEHGELLLVPAEDAPGRFVEASPSIRHFDVDRASKNVEVAAHLVAKGFVDAPVDQAATGLFEADTPSVELTLRNQGAPLRIYLGALHPSGKLHLRTSLSDQVYLVSKHLASSLLPKAEHFERSEAEMEELRAMAREASERAEHSSHKGETEHEGSHTHGSSLPTTVPAELMVELRARAREQRHERADASR